MQHNICGYSLLVVIVLAVDLHEVSHEVDGVEADTKLTNQVDVPARLHLLQERCGARKRQINGDARQF